MKLQEIVPEAVIAEAYRIVKTEYRFSLEQFAALMQAQDIALQQLSALPLKELREAYVGTLQEVEIRLDREDPSDPEDFDLGSYISGCERFVTDTSTTTSTVMSLRVDHREKLIAFFQHRGGTQEEATEQADDVLANADLSGGIGTFVIIDVTCNEPEDNNLEEDDVEESAGGVDTGSTESGDSENLFPEGEIHGLVQCVTFLPAPDVAGGDRGVCLSKVIGGNTYLLLWESIQWALSQGYATIWTDCEPEKEGWLDVLTECNFKAVGRMGGGQHLLCRPLYDLEYLPLVLGHLWDE